MVFFLILPFVSLFPVMKKCNTVKTSQWRIQLDAIAPPPIRSNISNVDPEQLTTFQDEFSRFWTQLKVKVTVFTPKILLFSSKYFMQIHVFA